MNYRKLVLAVVLALACVIGALIYVRDNLIEKTEFIPDITDLTKNYLAEDEIKAALEKRGAADIQPVEVITTLPVPLMTITPIFSFWSKFST